MKNSILLLLLLLLSYNGKSQTQTLVEFAFPTENNKIIYQEVVEVDSSMSSKEIYLLAKEWIAEQFKSAQDVIQLDDEKKIVLKAFIVKGHNTTVKNPKHWFTLRIEFKDGRYRYTLSDIIYEFDIFISPIHNHYEESFDTWLKYSSKRNKNLRERINRELEKYALDVNREFESILASLQNSISTSTEDDW